MSSPYARALCLLIATVGLTSCTARQSASSATTQFAIKGRAMGGEIPIKGATVHLYLVGNTGAESQATDLLNSPVTTSDGTGVGGDASNAGNTMAPGFFTITGDYAGNCPTGTLVSDDLVYLATVGGNTGAGENDSQVNLVALGHCKDLPNVSFIVDNEVTTVGTVAALYHYMGDDGGDYPVSSNYDKIGSTSEDANFAAAFNEAAEYMNFADGTAPGPALPSGYDASSNDVRALANAVQSCVNSQSNNNSLSSTCQSLFDDASNEAFNYPADTVYALYNIFLYPPDSPGDIFALQGPEPAFEPTNAMAPPDWTLPILPLPVAPIFSPDPAAGTINSTQSISISDATSNTVIYYTTDGSTPSTSSSIYSGPFYLTSSATVKAFVVEDSRLSSSITSGTYSITTVPLTAPTFSLLGGTYTGAQMVTISDSSAYNPHYYYTTDGSTPTLASTQYTGPITVSASETINAIAYSANSGYGPSAVSTASYVISAPAPELIRTFAGSGYSSFYGDGVYATDAQFKGPQDVKVYNGYVYVADTTNGFIRKIDLNSGIITTVTGTTVTNAAIPGITFDSSGNLYYSVVVNGTAEIERMDATTGNTTTYLGGASGNINVSAPVPIGSFAMEQPWGITMDAANDLYFVDTARNKVYVVYNGGAAAASLITATGQTPTSGNVYLIAGLSTSNTAGYTPDGSPATASQLSAPAGICLDARGNVIFSEFGNSLVRKINATTGVLSTVVGYTNVDSFSSPKPNNGDGESATSSDARLNEPVGVTYDASGNLYVADSIDQEIRKVDATTGILSTVSTSTSIVGRVRGVAVDNATGNIYAASYGNNTVVKVDTTGATTTFAGSGAAPFMGGFGGPATQAELYFPEALAFDAGGDLYITDYILNRVLKVDASTGYLTVFAGIPSQDPGTGSGTSSSGVATSIGLAYPHGVVVDSHGNVYIADTYNSVIRKVDTSGNSTVYAGILGSFGTSGDGGAATSATLAYPAALAVDANDDLFIADYGSYCIREVAESTGDINTVAGNCNTANSGSGFAGDNGPATDPAARLSFSSPAGDVGNTGLAITASGDIYFSDGTRVRIVYEGGTQAATLLSALGITSPVTGDLYTIAGNGTYGYNGDNILATNSELGEAVGVVVDAGGNVFVATQDQLFSQADGNDRIRRIDGTTGMITTYVSSTGIANFGGDGGSAISGLLDAPTGLALDAAGNLYIGDTHNFRVREVSH